MATARGVGERVRELRRERGLSQEQVAGPGVTASYVSLIESGRRQPTEAALAILAAALETSVDDLREGQAGERRREAEFDLRAAELALATGAFDDAEQRFRGLLDSSVAEDVRHAARHGLAQTLESLGQIEQAIALYEQIRDRAVSARDSGWVNVTIALVRCYREAGDLGRSADLGEQALDLLKSVGNPRADYYVRLIASVAFTAYERGDLVRARQLIERAIDEANALGSPRAQGAALWNAAVIAAERGEIGTALEFSEQALLHFQEEEGTRNSARLRNSFAELLLRTDPPDPDRALVLLESARDDLAQTGSITDLAYCETEIARCHLLMGDVDAAIGTARQALHHLPAAEDRLERSRALATLADAWLAAGDSEASEAAYREAAQTLTAAGAGRQAAKLWQQLGEHLERRGDLAGALAAFKSATNAVGLGASSDRARISS